MQFNCSKCIKDSMNSYQSCYNFPSNHKLVLLYVHFKKTMDWLSKLLITIG